MFFQGKKRNVVKLQDTRNPKILKMGYSLRVYECVHFPLGATKVSASSGIVSEDSRGVICVPTCPQSKGTKVLVGEDQS